MTSGKFAFCFLGKDGNVVCRHHTGNWIVFPSTGGNNPKGKHPRPKKGKGASKKA